MITWIGHADLLAAEEENGKTSGPIAQALEQLEISHTCILSNYPPAKGKAYLEWIKRRTSGMVELHQVTITSPVDFGDIYKTASHHTASITDQHPDATICFHLSPGTSAMAAVWILLGKTRHPALFIQSSPEQGARFVDIPFDISAEFLPDLLRPFDQRLTELSSSSSAPGADFEQIIHRSQPMARAIAKANQAARRSIPVLLEGESGTGKELFANAIHSASPRSGHPFITVNCGAIPHELIESELFGHTKGAFTGATRNRKGHFQNAHRGTLFLDEIGELPPAAQVKLLRAIQEGEVTPVGSSIPVSVNTRIIAATNKNLLEESTEGRFRADLFYRLAVAIIKLPPLRRREGDLSLLVDALLAQVNKESREEPGYIDKKLSASAKNILLRHSWPGNVRELLNTLRRMAIWTNGDTIQKDDAQEALLPTAPQQDPILDKDITEGVNLPEIIKQVSRHYLQQAMRSTGGNKTRAAELLNLPNYQTLTNWLKKYRIEH